MATTKGKKRGRKSAEEIGLLVSEALRNLDELESLEESLDWVRTPFVFYKRKAIYLADYCYDELINTYVRMFPRVLVLKFEDMIGSPETFCEKLSSFVGVPSNVKEIEHELGMKHNPSMDGNDVFRKRQDNLLRLADRLFGCENWKIDDCAQIGVGRDPIMSRELRERIQEFLSGKCHGYY